MIIHLAHHSSIPHTPSDYHEIYDSKASNQCTLHFQPNARYDLTDCSHSQFTYLLAPSVIFHEIIETHWRRFSSPSPTAISKPPIAGNEVVFPRFVLSSPLPGLPCFAPGRS
jgi:hypothetical protein